MAYIVNYWFRARLSKPAIMDFIARTPMESYALIPEGDWVYGTVLSDDVMEFLVNECLVQTLEILPAAEVRKLGARPGARLWGNRELLSL